MLKIFNEEKKNLWLRRSRYIAICLLLLVLLGVHMPVGIHIPVGVNMPGEHVIQQSSLTTTTLTPPPANNLGVNYYHESMGYIGRTDAEIANDLAQIQLVTNKIKVYHNPYTNAGDVTSAVSLQIVKNIVQMAKVRKMYVVWVENDDSVTLTDANWNDYASKVMSDAAEAQQAGADEYLVGNEISLHNNGDLGFSDINLPAHIKQLVIDSQANFPGVKGYEDGWFKSGSWKNATLGPVDKIYFTLYESWNTYQSAFAQIVDYFGQRAEIGEVSTKETEGQLNDTDADWARDLMRRYDYARQTGLTIWLFTFDDPGNNGYGLVTSSLQFHTIWEYLRNRITLTYHVFLSNTFDNGTTQAFSGGYNFEHHLSADAFAQTLATVPISDYVFRGVLSPLQASGSDPWRAMRLVFRYSDANNYYFINIEPNDNKLQLFRRAEGKESFLGETTTPISLQTEYDFEVRVSGSAAATKIQFFWDTAKIFNITDKGNINLNSGKVGMKNNGVGGYLDNILVTDFEQ